MNINQLAARLAASAALAPAHAKSVTEDTAETISEEWAADAPVLTGQYRDSIQAEGNEAFSTAPYAPFVIFGTSDTPPQDSLTPAVDRNLPIADEAILDLLESDL